MKIVVINNLRDNSSTLYDLLLNEKTVDFIILTGEIGKKSAKLLKSCLVPTMIVSKKSEFLEQLSWPNCYPYGVIYDNNLRLIVNYEPLTRLETMNMILKFRVNLVLSPEFEEKFMEYSFEKNSGLVSIPDFEKEYVIIENFFNSVQVGLFETINRKKLSEISFFW